MPAHPSSYCLVSIKFKFVLCACDAPTVSLLIDRLYTTRPNAYTVSLSATTTSSFRAPARTYYAWGDYELSHSRIPRTILPAFEQKESLHVGRLLSNLTGTSRSTGNLTANRSDSNTAHDMRSKHARTIQYRIECMRRAFWGNLRLEANSGGVGTIPTKTYELQKANRLDCKTKIRRKRFFRLE